MSLYHNLSDPELKEFEEAKAIFTELMDNLHSKDKLRKGIGRYEREKLAKMWALSRQIGIALNKTMNIFDPEKLQKFEIANREFNLTAQNLTDSLINQMIGFFLYNIEVVLKFSLLFFIKKDPPFRTKMTIGELIRAVEIECPTIAPDFKELIDVDIRNALAHGSFWFERPNICFTRDLEFSSTTGIPFHEFWIRTKKQNIRAHALTEVLYEKINQNYFHE